MSDVAGNIKIKQRTERLREFFEKMWAESANYGERLDLLFTLCMILKRHGINTIRPRWRSKK